MRILIFSVTYLPFVGGAEMAVKEITDRIGNFQFDLITARLDKKIPQFEKIGNVNVYRVGQGWLLDKYLFPWLAYFKAKKLHQKRNYQIVQAIMAFYAGLAALFFKWRYPSVKYLLTMQSGDSDFFIWLRTWFWYPLYKKIYTKADYIQAISQFLAQRARKYGYQGEIEVVPNGVDIDKFQIPNSKFQTNSKFQITNYKQELGIKSDEKVVITVSRLVKKNGIDDLIKAINKSRIMNHELRIKLLIIGSGKEEKKLKLQVTPKRNQRFLTGQASYKLQDRVIFLGHISHQDLPQYLSIADVFVRPSLSEGLGSAFLEAMAAGLPIIGTPVGGIPDFLVDGETGLFCQPRNPQSIAEKINQLFTDNQLREKIIANGQRLVEEKYNWPIIAQKMKNIFSSIV